MFDKVQAYDIKTKDDVIQRRAIREQLNGEEVVGQEKCEESLHHFL